MIEISSIDNVNLSLTELDIIEAFINQVSLRYDYKMSSNEAQKFLRVKKFDLNSSLELYNNHKTMRMKEQLLEIDPFDKYLAQELSSEKFTFLLQPDTKTGAMICIFTAKQHFPSKTSHNLTLKSLIFQLDAALKTKPAQKNGIIFLYDMNGSLYSNFDYQLSVKILNLLKGAYPARLCKVIIFTPPLWFRTAFNLLRLFVRDKLQSRITIVTDHRELHSHLSAKILPCGQLKGLTPHRHCDWLSFTFKCNNASRTVSGDNYSIQSGTNGLSTNHNFKLDECKPPGSDVGNKLNGCVEVSPDSSSGVVSAATNQLQSSSGTDEDHNTLNKQHHRGNPPVNSNHHQIETGDAGDIDYDVDDDDFEMMSLTSWEFNLEPSGDEDVMIDDPITTNTNSTSDEACLDDAVPPNIICASPRVIMNPTHPLKRRNALRQHNSNKSASKSTQSTTGSNKKRLPSWSLNRPDCSQPSLHQACLIDGEDQNTGAANAVGSSGVTIDYFNSSEKHSFYSTLNEFRSDLTYGDSPLFTAYNNPLNACKNRYSDVQCTESSRVKLLRNHKHKSASQKANGIPSQSPNNAATETNDSYWSNAGVGVATNLVGSSCALSPTTNSMDYIHANWVDGYRQKNAYICTQGPLASTVVDFWHMIVQYRVPIIVMTTRPREQNRDKCFQYWPEQQDQVLTFDSSTWPGGISADAASSSPSSSRSSSPMTSLFGSSATAADAFQIQNIKSKEIGPCCPSRGQCQDSPEQHWYRVTLLQVTNLNTGQQHRVNHFYFHSWPDQGIPHSSEGFLHFIIQIRQTYRLNIAKIGYESEFDQDIPPPPIVVHCSAGIGRTGTYIVTEICCKSLWDCGRFNLHETMLKVRSQRHKSVQNAYQYLFCRNTIIDFAKFYGLLKVTPSPPLTQDNDEEEEEEINSSHSDAEHSYEEEPEPEVFRSELDPMDSP